MRLAALFALFTFCLTACFESESDTKKVELVDNTTKNTNTGKQAVADEDFAALQEEVKKLKDELAALKTGKADAADVTALGSDVSTVQTTVSGHSTSITSLNTTVGSQGTRLTAAEADIAAHDSELNALNSTVNALASQESLQQLYLYDGNKVKRHPVVSVYDRDAWQEAIVEIEEGVNARYYVGRFADANSQQSPAPYQPESPYTSVNVRYQSSGCTGKAIIYDPSAGADWGQAGTIGNYLVWITSATERHNGFSYASTYDGSSCTNGSSNSVGKGSTAVVVSKSTYTYPNPLTVGP